MNNCPFYGRHLHLGDRDNALPILLIDSRGNQCALVTTAFAPCRMEIAGRAVDWAECPLIAEIRL